MHSKLPIAALAASLSTLSLPPAQAQVSIEDDPNFGPESVVRDLASGETVVWHTGSSWGFRSVIQRFEQAGLAVAIACNDDYAWPQLLAYRIADRLLEDDLGSEIDLLLESEQAQDAGKAAATPVRLTVEQRQQFVGEFYSYELDATYRITDDDGLSVRIEQEAPISLRAINVDQLEFWFAPKGWGGDGETVTLNMRRDAAGEAIGFLLSAGNERHIKFKRRQ